MPKVADTGTKRLIAIAPDSWAQWVTQRPEVVAQRLLTTQFQWISRDTDALILAYSPELGKFLIISEIQLRYDPRMPLRVIAYASLAEEHYNLPVYPVVVNILPPSAKVTVVDRYEREFLGLYARRDFRVINLWEVDVELVFDGPIPSLLPFVPVLRGGGEERVIRKAVHLLRKEEDLRQFEALLAFFARFALESHVIQQIMRWDMVVLEQSPWYNEILERGREKGREEGRDEGLHEGLAKGREEGREEGRIDLLQRMIERRFGPLPERLATRLAHLSREQVETVLDVALTAPSLEALLHALDAADGREPESQG